MYSNILNYLFSWDKTIYSFVCFFGGGVWWWWWGKVSIQEMNTLWILGRVSTHYFLDTTSIVGFVELEHQGMGQVSSSTEFPWRLEVLGLQHGWETWQRLHFGRVREWRKKCCILGSGGWGWVVPRAWPHQQPRKQSARVHCCFFLGEDEGGGWN